MTRLLVCNLVYEYIYRCIYVYIYRYMCLFFMHAHTCTLSTSYTHGYDEYTCTYRLHASTHMYSLYTIHTCLYTVSKMCKCRISPGHEEYTYVHEEYLCAHTLYAYTHVFSWCMLHTCHFPQKSPMISGSLAERDLQRLHICILLMYVTHVSIQKGQDVLNASSPQVIFRKRALWLVALWRRETCNFYTHVHSSCILYACLYRVAKIHRMP